MFDIGWMELMVIGVVALIVVGPRDLPEMFRQLGRFTGKLKSMAREFNRAMEQAANDSGMKDAVRDLNAIADPRSTAINSVKGAVDKFEKWDPIKNAAKPTVPLQHKGPLVPPPMPATPAPAAAPALAEPAAVAEPAPAPAPVGPNTQALYEKQAQRRAIMEEANAKLKALDQAPATDAEVAAAKPAKPRAPRKKKTDEAQS